MNKESMCFQTGGQSAYNNARASLSWLLSPASCRFHTCPLRSNLWLATWTKRDMGTEGEQAQDTRTSMSPCRGQKRGGQDCEQMAISSGLLSMEANLEFLFFTLFIFFVTQLIQEYILGLHDLNNTEFSKIKYKNSL